MVDGDAGPSPSTPSLVNVTGGGIEIPAVLYQGRAMLLRLFNAEGDGEERTLSLGVKPSQVELVELDGRVIRQLDVRRAAGGRYEVKVAIPRFGIRTLRVELPDSRVSRRNS